MVGGLSYLPATPTPGRIYQRGGRSEGEAGLAFGTSLRQRMSGRSSCRMSRSQKGMDARAEGGRVSGQVERGGGVRDGRTRRRRTDVHPSQHRRRDRSGAKPSAAARSDLRPQGARRKAPEQHQPGLRRT